MLVLFNKNPLGIWRSSFKLLDDTFSQEAERCPTVVKWQMPPSPLHGQRNAVQFKPFLSQKTTGMRFVQLLGRMSFIGLSCIFNIFYMEPAVSGLAYWSICLLMHAAQAHRTAIHTGARQLHPNYTSPTDYLHSGCCVAWPHGKTNCVWGGLGTEGRLNFGAAVAVAIVDG